MARRSRTQRHASFVDETTEQSKALLCLLLNPPEKNSDRLGDPYVVHI